MNSTVSRVVQALQMEELSSTTGQWFGTLIAP
jgi:hypothetical protein